MNDHTAKNATSFPANRSMKWNPHWRLGARALSAPLAMLLAGVTFSTALSTQAATPGSAGTAQAQEPVQSSPSPEGDKSIGDRFRVTQTASGQTAGTAPVGAQEEKGKENTSETLETLETLHELTVTAEKIEESSQVVASSVNAQDARTLEQNKLEQLADYAAYIPGLVVGNGGSPGQASISIRGISPNIGVGSAVATYIDEAPLGSSGLLARANEFELDLPPFDLERLELLRGPQGTLYGANSLGGVLKYVLTTPNPSSYDAEIGTDVGAIDGGRGALTTVNGRVNIPIIPDEAAVSLSGYDKHSPGYIDDLSTGGKGTNAVDQYGGRVALFWRPSNQFSLKLNAMYQRTDSKDDGIISYTNLNAVKQSDGTIWVNPASGYDGRLTESHPLLQPFATAPQYYAATANWNPGPVEVVSATSYSRTHTSQVGDDSALDGALFPLLTQGAVPAGLVKFLLGLDLDKFTEELRLVSPRNQPIEWILGAFYTHESLLNVQSVYAYDLNFNPIPQFAPVLASSRSRSTYEERAVFGDATWHMTQKLDVTAGARFSPNIQSNLLTTSGALIAGVGADSASSTAHVTTWMADARYRFTSDVMAYVRVATGYEPGAPQFYVANVPDLPTSVGAETLTNYELGLKSELLDHRALMNLSVYDIEWQNIQLPADYHGIGALANGGAATTHGFEFESQLLPINGLKLGLNVAYTDAYLDSLKPEVSIPFLLHTQLGTVPSWTVSTTADYAFAPAPNWTARVGGGIRWVDTQWATERAEGQNTAILPAYTAVDLNASATQGRWTLFTYVRNLMNVRAIQGASVKQDVFGNYVQMDYAILQPRTVGAGFQLKFD